MSELPFTNDREPLRIPPAPDIDFRPPSVLYPLIICVRDKELRLRYDEPSGKIVAEYDPADLDEAAQQFVNLIRDMMNTPEAIQRIPGPLKSVVEDAIGNALDVVGWRPPSDVPMPVVVDEFLAHMTRRGYKIDREIDSTQQ